MQGISVLKHVIGEGAEADRVQTGLLLGGGAQKGDNPTGFSLGADGLLDLFFS